MKEDTAKLGCRNRTVVALNWEGWRKLLNETKAHPGLECCWRERERERERERKKIMNSSAI